jgi:signal transduction histidine kinase
MVVDDMVWFDRLEVEPRLAWDVVVRRLIGAVVLVALVVVTTLYELRHWSALRSPVALALVAVTVVGLVLGRVVIRRRPRLATPMLLALAALSGLLGGLSPHTAGSVLPYVAVGYIAVRLPPLLSSVIAAATVAIMATGLWLNGELGFWVLLFVPVALLGGMMRRAYNQRVEQTQLLLVQTERARQAEARSAALGERARIAREIHDVLAHSLAALAVQLEAADALLSGGRTERAQQVVRQSRQLAREGLAETKQAVMALRDGAASPLPVALEALVGTYGLDGRAGRVRVAGEPVELGPEARFALYRIAQEALTNAIKHAPGAPVRVDLRYGPGEVVLTVANDACAEPADRPLAGAGGGYGLTGMRERVEPLGGELIAGPADGGWRVTAKIPV